ncbi:MAG: phosphoenolpyruvate carboxykinase (ATP) [Halobacteriales archaeon]|nr:phosphoenolpyruvate carboxykinase (ATP) [Halobacteriales archaeon]
MSELGVAVVDALPEPGEAENVVYNPSEERMRELSEHLETTTEFGSASYVSEYRSRCADRTKNGVDDDFDATDRAVFEKAFRHAREEKFVCVDRVVGAHPDHSYVCRFYVTEEYARVALTLSKLLEPADEGVEPDFVTVQAPDLEPEDDEVAIRVLPEEGVTAVLGSDYTGEAKKSFLRLFMYRVKQAGGLGLHAGSKRVRVRRDGDDEPTDIGQLFLGLSATGKSTLTAHGLGLEGDEGATMLQDDVCGLLPDGTVVGSEGRGLYVKTAGLDADEQPTMHAAVTHESAVLENVDVGDDGTVDFDSDRYTTNGRACILREHLSSADDEEIDLGRVDQVFFITRNPAMPPVARLPPESAAVAFMLGESIETSAGDPSRAGESVRVVGTNPFIMGSEGEEGNRFRDLVSELKVDCFVLNTGCVGDETNDICVEDSVAVLRAVARGTVEWKEDETGMTVPVPESVPGVDLSSLCVPDALEDAETRLEELRDERRRYLEGFDDLADEIRNAVY